MNEPTLDQCYMPEVCNQGRECCYGCGFQYPAPDLRGILQALQFAITLRQKDVGRGNGGRELALVQTKLDETRLWLGEFEAATEGD